MASSPSPPKSVVGIAAWGMTTDEIRYGLDVLRELNCTELDTAQGYPMSEELLGKAGAADGFVIATKCSLPFGPTVATKDEVIKAGKESLEKLKVKSVSFTTPRLLPLPSLPLHTIGLGFGISGTHGRNRPNTR